MGAHGGLRKGPLKLFFVYYFSMNFTNLLKNKSICKVSGMFVILSADPPPSIVRKYRDALQLLAPKLWPPPPERDQLEDAWVKTTSIVIVRHPLARLASVYYQVEQQRKPMLIIIINIFWDSFLYVSFDKIQP